MKKGFLVWLALFLAVPNAEARENAEPLVLPFEEKPALVYGGDSVRLWLDFAVPGELVNRRTYHRTEVWLMSVNDPELCWIVGIFRLQGDARKRFVKRELKRQGVEPPKILWSRKYKVNKKKVEPVNVRIATLCREWMTEDVLVRVDQYHSARFKDSVEMVATEYLVPSVRFNGPVRTR